MHLVLGPLAFMLAINSTLFSLVIGGGQTTLEIGRDGRLLNGCLVYGRRRVERGELTWQWRRGLTQHYALGKKAGAGSRYWTDADLTPVAPLPPI